MPRPAGIPSCAMRLICHVPVGIVSVVGIQLYNAADHLQPTNVFEAIPSGGDFLLGLQIVAIAGTVTFAWNIIIWFASTWCNGFVLGVLGICDLALAAGLISGITLQHRFLPGTYSECGGAANWKAGSDGQNFFQMFADSDRQEREDAVCRSFVQNWILAVVVVVLYLVCSVTNIVLGFGEKLLLPPSLMGKGKWETTYKIRRIYWCLWIVGCIKYGGPYALAAARFSYRYGCKFLAAYNSRKDGSAPPLHVAGQDGPAQHDCTAELGQTTKSQCFVCRGRICTRCQHSTNITYDASTLNHLKQCRPRCSRCIYFKSHLKSWPGTNVLYPSPAAAAPGSRMVCAMCFNKCDKERLDMLEARDKIEAKRLTMLPLVCGECKEPLKSTGPRWWVMLHNDRECTHGSHVHWANT